MTASDPKSAKSSTPTPTATSPNPSAVAPAVVVNTRKYDIHRRYVGHVFYAFNNQDIEKTFLKGRYLNQELIDKGHAKPV